MTIVRHLLLTLILVAILPWGAVRAAHGPVTPAAVAAQDEHHAQAPRTRFETAEHRRCPIRALPSSPCGPYLPPAAILVVTAGAWGGLVPVDAARRTVDRSERPPHAPPRAG